MKFNRLLFLLCFAYFSISAEERTNYKEYKEAKKQRLMQRKAAKCTKCYCSELCGPRKVQPDDTPFYDEEYGICFCKPRDKELYSPHRCRITPADRAEIDCCTKE